MSLKDLFSGAESLSSKTDPVTVESLTGEGRVLGLYFSAHWCPPCRAFTPQLANWYKKFKKTENGSKFEIVFVSSDRDEQAFQEYYNEMPWLALPYNQRELKGNLSKKFKVQGIPTLVFVNGQTGGLITADGRAVVTDDPEGKDFPWTPKKVTEIIAEGSLVTKTEQKVDWNGVKEEVIGLYFSAHWCGPCRAFTPQLIKTYKKIREDNKSFEIIFVSSDRDEDAMKEYYDTMPWLALPFGDKRKKALSTTFSISGIPSLVIMKKDGEVITTHGRTAISGDSEGKEFPWYPKPLNELSGATAGELNDCASLVWFTTDKANAEKVMKPIAEEYVAKHKDDEDKVCFFYTACDDDDDVGDSLKTFAGITEKSALAFINIPEQEVYKTYDAVDAGVIKKVLDGFLAKSLEMKPLGS